jgi:drug/metabolite transporter (DMT)-like permease
MFDEVTRQNILPVAIRTSQVTFSLYVGYQALQFFQTTTVTMVQNLSPMVTVFFAYLILKENITN